MGKITIKIKLKVKLKNQPDFHKTLSKLQEINS